MGVRIVVCEGESLTLALRRFRKHLERTGSVYEMRRRKYFVDEGHWRRAKRFKKRFKSRLATVKEQQAGIQPVASLPEAVARLWERTGKP